MLSKYNWDQQTDISELGYFLLHTFFITTESTKRTYLMLLYSIKNLFHAIVFCIYYGQHMQQCMFSRSVVWIVHKVQKASLITVFQLLQTIYYYLMLYNYFTIVQLSKLLLTDPLTDITTYRAAIIAKLSYASLHFTIILMYYWNCINNDYFNWRLRTNCHCYLWQNNWLTL